MDDYLSKVPTYTDLNQVETAMNEAVKADKDEFERSERDEVLAGLVWHLVEKYVPKLVGDHALQILETYYGKPVEESWSSDLTLSRFIEMITERGLSAYQYTEPRYSALLGNFTTVLVEVRRNGHKLATYDINVIQYFTEAHIAQELDKLKSAIVVPAERIERD